MYATSAAVSRSLSTPSNDGITSGNPGRAEVAQERFVHANAMHRESGGVCGEASRACFPAAWRAAILADA
jgi:hypothetical protein